ncbi:hypothetical protein E2C01_002774 [Portunus trituberculatus]|uniref:Secreted protein n=1 Tax=Portunus trituberculatus TaxID=210409 RepID=A0A5B7CLM7_PORTR|nr:hypothetical protein [Portunus trituberculatus]
MYTRLSLFIYDIIVLLLACFSCESHRQDAHNMAMGGSPVLADLHLSRAHTTTDEQHVTLGTRQTAGEDDGGAITTTSGRLA